MCAKNTAWYKAIDSGVGGPVAKSAEQNLFGDNASAFASQYQAQGPKAPGAAPDLTDDVIRKARVAQLMRLRMARGRASTFLTDDGTTASGDPNGT